jgi:hypothetical protein
MIYSYMDLSIQIGQGVHTIEEVLLGYVLVQELCHDVMG